MTIDLTGEDLVIVRELKATPGQAFRAWSVPEQLARWMGPGGFVTPVVESDLREGGSYRICIRPPEGEVYWWGGRYVEVDEPYRLAFTVEYYGSPGEATLEGAPMTMISLTFESMPGGTRMTFRQSPFPPIVDRADHADGWVQALNKLDDLFRAEQASGGHDA